MTRVTLSNLDAIDPIANGAAASTLNIRRDFWTTLRAPTYARWIQTATRQGCTFGRKWQSMKTERKSFHKANIQSRSTKCLADAAKD
ncbi:hypothetical protein A0H81_02909 [Grifola frondosa]|uniref:Uncharacterized protein n=1 Tax=Grifola frondosa TaxID=5627 RepID=A0A1C7MJ25_GRIFR|nr:hypothetical protein A0H81_02909 [Grifola frondosa]